MTSQSNREREPRPNVKAEHPDPEAAARNPQDGEDRPGFDLGGASEEGRKGGPKNTIPGGPRGGAVPDAPTGRGRSGSEASGPTAGSGKPRF